MAELATIARPYAEALFKTGGGSALAAEIGALGAVAADEDLRPTAARTPSAKCASIRPWPAAR